MILALVMQRPFSGGGSSHSRIRIRLGMVGIKTQQAGEEGMPSGLRPSWSGGSRGWIMQGLGQHGEALGFYSKLSRMPTKDFKQENN